MVSSVSVPSLFQYLLFSSLSLLTDLCPIGVAFRIPARLDQNTLCKPPLIRRQWAQNRVHINQYLCLKKQMTPNVSEVPCSCKVLFLTTLNRNLVVDINGISKMAAAYPQGL